MKRLALVLLLALCVLPSMAQVVVDGRVMDDANEPLPSVIIRNYAPSHKLRGYTTSDTNGHFSIPAEIGDTLEFTMLGYESSIYAVEKDNSNITVKMRSSAITLKEVVAKSDKVREHGDTISYMVGAYASGADRSIGDVIARMPGFDVDNRSGKISYEGKPISKFYIDGIDMLGGKYGIATNSLPQGEVGVVEVMRNHQPIRVLDDFTFTDDNAVNIKMKDSAKNRWVTSWKLGGGYGDNDSEYGHGDKGLYQFEGFGVRLSSAIQTMLTYKANNIGVDVGRETTNLFSEDESDIQQPRDFIALSSPTTSGISEERGLMNRSHAVTANTMKRINEYSQINFQLTYDHERQQAWGESSSEYTRKDGNLVIDNWKQWRETDNTLYGLIKYEHNSNKSYFRNSLSGNLAWASQNLTEIGSATRKQHANVPVYDLKENLYLILRKGKTLLTFYSYNTFKSMPQNLDVDSTITQSVNQRYFSTNTYGMGGWKAGNLSLSLKLGVKGLYRSMDANAIGLPDSLGTLKGKSHFGYLQLYASPQIEYVSRTIKYTLAAPLDCTYYKYSEDGGKHRVDISPLVNIRWDMTPRFLMSLNCSYAVAPIDFNRFYNSIIMQDYLYLNKGQLGYDVATSTTLRGILSYRNALRGTHLIASITRARNGNPYTMTRSFVGDYIVIGTTAQKTNDYSWNGNLMFQQSVPWLKGKLSLRGMYTHTDSKLLQDNSMMNSTYNNLNVQASLDMSLFRDVSATLSTRYNYNDMRAEEGERTSLRTWRQKLALSLPLSNFRIKVLGEYNHNQIYKEQYKDMFFLDAALGYNMKHFDWELKASNIFNKQTYSYSRVSNLITTKSTTAIRGREIMLAIAYKP